MNFLTPNKTHDDGRGPDKDTNVPQTPLEVPLPTVFERVTCRLLPHAIRPQWKLDDLFSFDLPTTEIPDREDIQIEWFTRTSDISDEEDCFLRKHVGWFWWIWKWRLSRNQCLLGLARWRGQLVHFTFVVWGGGAIKPYRDLMAGRAGLIGPSLTTVQARGRGIFPYMIAKSLARLWSKGYSHAYIHARTTNTSSIRSIGKVHGHRRVGRFLLRRRLMGRYRIVAGATCSPCL